MFCESAPVPVRLDASTGGVLLLVRFSYNDRDPFAVQAAFFDGPCLLARWRFDRQMLAEGLHRPVGEGDVAFRPHARAGIGELRIDLRGQGGEREEEAVLFVDADPLAVFLEQTYTVIGAGEEFLDLDRLLDEFLAR
ncbi:SsgA family sporulation/cell division regulator [Streptomyces sp. NPDC099050]|uniref:SsgA family sporulation/cell division regulator n=1 Tax=Streptomyces sp. NPDC099050 TaxID=3366100 RepID=UPI0037F8F04D